MMMQSFEVITEDIDIQTEISGCLNTLASISYCSFM